MLIFYFFGPQIFLKLLKLLASWPEMIMRGLFFLGLFILRIMAGKTINVHFKLPKFLFKLLHFFVFLLELVPVNTPISRYYIYFV